jgi:hypothetical protein
MGTHFLLHLKCLKIVVILKSVQENKSNPQTDKNNRRTYLDPSDATEFTTSELSSQYKNYDGWQSEA